MSTFTPRSASRDRAADRHIFRKRRTRDFTIIGNVALNDEQLSAGALGLLCYLLSKPDDWVVRTRELMARFHVGRDVIRRLLRELEDAGYMVSRQGQAAHGRWAAIEHDVYDEPQAAHQQAEEPSATLSRPWETAGISRASWYRRRISRPHHEAAEVPVESSETPRPEKPSAVRLRMESGESHHASAEPPVESAETPRPPLPAPVTPHLLSTESQQVLSLSKKPGRKRSKKTSGAGPLMTAFGGLGALSPDQEAQLAGVNNLFPGEGIDWRTFEGSILKLCAHLHAIAPQIQRREEPLSLDCIKAWEDADLDPEACFDVLRDFWVGRIRRHEGVHGLKYFDRMVRNCSEWSPIGGMAA